MKPEEYYGTMFSLLKNGEAYLKNILESYPDDNTKDELSLIHI